MENFKDDFTTVPETHTSPETLTAVEIEFEYQTSFGSMVSKQTIHSFELPDNANEKDLSGERATYFDGYIKTAHGDFAYQGTITSAKAIIAIIKEFCIKSEKYNSLLQTINKERSVHDVAIARWRNTSGELAKILEESGNAANRKKMEAEVEANILKSRIEKLRNDISAYKL